MSSAKTNDADTARATAGARGRHLEDGERRLGNGPRRHGDAVLRPLALVDGDYVEGRRRDVQVREASVLQVVEVALGQSVPGGRGQRESHGEERVTQHNTTQEEVCNIWTVFDRFMPIVALFTRAIMTKCMFF